MEKEMNEKQARVFVADDDATVRMLARECLEAAGFQVEEAENGRRALDRIAVIQPDVVILDVMMPELDGYEVCRQVRKMPGNDTLPILMMTALDDVESIHSAYTAGASEFTTKPVNWTVESYRLNNMLRFAGAIRQIELSRQEWERTFNSLDELVIVYDDQMSIIQANHAARTAVRTPMGDILGRTCSDVFRREGSDCSRCPIKESLASGKKTALEWAAPCFGGIFLVSIFPVSNGETRPGQVVCLAKDITERKRLDNELRCAQKMDAIGTLSEGLAHDFNNLLQIINGYAEVSLKELPPESALWKNVDTIRKAAWRGGEITRQLMAVGRNVESRPAPLMLNQTVTEMVGLLKRTFPRSITMAVSLAENLNWVNADAAQIEQVVMNLAVNAKHAMPQGGELIFETWNVELDAAYCRMHPSVKSGKYVMLSVTDSGCGMDAKTQERIFEPFFSTRSSSEGTGLGLSMVYGIIRKHDGYTLCYSEQGQGTTFKIYLPALESEGGPPVDKTAEQHILTGNDELVLLVDDEPDIRNIAKNFLLRVGYSVLLAANGQEALDIIREEKDRIDLMVLDLNMPVMGGLECLDRLRAGGSKLPVLLASGFALNEESRKRLDDTVDYLNKPYQMNEFLQKIGLMLKNRCVS